MFDVGFAELLLLSIIGLLVLGPERLPKVARTLGGLTRKARSSWLNLKRSIEAEIRAEEMKKPLKEFQDKIKSRVDEAHAGVDSLRQNIASTPPEKSAKTAKTSPPERHDPEE
jgi:sec-independent protein translocase protein TatB